MSSVAAGRRIHRMGPGRWATQRLDPPGGGTEVVRPFRGLRKPKETTDA